MGEDRTETDSQAFLTIQLLRRIRLQDIDKENSGEGKKSRQAGTPGVAWSLDKAENNRELTSKAWFEALKAH